MAPSREALHAQGATVVLSGRQADKLEALKAKLGDRALVQPCDLANKEQVAKLIDEAVKLVGGRLDILVNNAGLTRDNLFMVMKDEQWDEVIAVNLTSTFMLMRAASRHMMRSRSGYGRIINISSVSGILGNPGQGNYAASKAGMIGMTKSLAREVASRGVTANCIAPGFIETPDDGGTEREADRHHQGGDPGPGFRQARRHRGGCRLSREHRSALHDRADAAHQWRHGDDLTQRGSYTIAVGQAPAAAGQGV